VASNDEPNLDFDDLELSSEPSEAGPVDGMPDPTAKSDEPLSEEELAEPAAEQEDESAEASPKKRGLFDRIAQANPYTILLAISLAAILVAIFCLVIQLANYSFDYKAKSATRQSASATIHSIEPVEAKLV
jgi:hypothetical protein